MISEEKLRAIKLIKKIQPIIKKERAEDPAVASYALVSLIVGIAKENNLSEKDIREAVDETIMSMMRKLK